MVELHYRAFMCSGNPLDLEILGISNTVVHLKSALGIFLISKVLRTALLKGGALKFQFFLTGSFQITIDNYYYDV